MLQLKKYQQEKAKLQKQLKARNTGKCCNSIVENCTDKFKIDTNKTDDNYKEENVNIEGLSRNTKFSEKQVDALVC